MSLSELLFVAFIAFLLFGGKRLPEIMKAAGRLVAQGRRQWQALKREAGLDMLDEIKATYRGIVKDTPREPVKVKPVKEPEDISGGEVGG